MNTSLAWLPISSQEASELAKGWHVCGVGRGIREVSPLGSLHFLFSIQQEQGWCLCSSSWFSGYSCVYFRDTLDSCGLGSDSFQELPLDPMCVNSQDGAK